METTFKLKALLSFLFFGIVFLAQAQNLVLKDIETGKTRTIKAGQTIHLKTADMENFEKAKIQSFNGQTLVILFPNEDDGTVMELPLSSITEISKITCLHKTSQAVGAACLVVGAYLMFGSGGLAGEDGSAGPYVAGGAVLFVAGVAPYLIKPKTYVLGTTHTAVIQ
jgi:hypothetical protein